MRFHGEVEVVHDREHSLLHLTAVPSVEDNLLVCLEVEDSSGLGVESELLVVINFCL